VTVVGNFEGGNQPFLSIFLEGDIDEGDYIKAAEEFAKLENKPFTTAKRGERKLLMLGEGNSAVYGVRVSKSLFVVATTRELIDDVLEKHAGKLKADVQPALLEWLKKAKPAETPLWLVVGELKLLKGINGGAATITLNDNADFRIEIACDKDDLAATIKNVLEQVVKYFDGAQSPQAKVWAAAGIKIKRDGRTVTATGSIPGKLLAEEYAKQK
jgi:hypothetical protein